MTQPTFFKEIPPYYEHQQETHDFIAERVDAGEGRVFDASDPGCVSADTEYLSPTGWVKIDSYEPGGLVGQFCPQSKKLTFVKPSAYIKRPCLAFYHIGGTRGTAQRLSAEHRMLLYRSDGTHFFATAKEYAENKALRRHSRIETSFVPPTTSGMYISDANLRLQIAVLADSYIPNDCKNCCIRIKKPRKKERLERLLKEAAVDYTSRDCPSAESFTIYRFEPPLRTKTYDARFWKATQRQLKIIVDECKHWDGSIRKANAFGFYSNDVASIDFIQYAAAATGHYTHSSWDKRGGGIVHISPRSTLVTSGRYTASLKIYTPPDGFKYCFEVATGCLLLRRNGYIFATGNTGKTRPAIGAFTERRKQGGGKALVLAPKSILQPAWGNDVDKFFPGTSHMIAYATNRKKAFEQDVDMYITNHDAAKWLFENMPKKYWNDFDTLIVDESTAFKNSQAGRSKFLYRLAKHFEYREIMTGTPNPNSVTELWHQCKILDDGESLGTSFWKFRSIVCEPVQIGPSAQHIKWKDKVGSEHAVFDMIDHMVIRHAYDDCHDSDFGEPYKIMYELPPKVMKQYKDMVDMAVTMLNDGSLLIAGQASAVHQKLMQIASGAVYKDDGTYSQVDPGRYELIMDLIEARQQCVVGFLWRHQREELVKAAEKRGFTFGVIDGEVKDREREEIVRKFQEGTLRIVFAHPKSAAHGLTLTAGTTTIWASPTYNSEFFTQLNARINRAGQTQRTETILVTATGTIDEQIYQRLGGKLDAMQILLDLLGDP